MTFIGWSRRICLLHRILCQQQHVCGLNASVIDEDVYTFTTQSETRDYNITWAGKATSNFHGFVGVLSVNGTVINLENNENFTAFRDDFFIPQLPSIVISSVSSV